MRSATKEDRRRLYAELYDELFLRVPNHPLMTRKSDPAASEQAVAEQMALLDRFLQPSTTYLEVGPGDCALALEVARHVKRVYAVDVSAELARRQNVPPNIELTISDGTSIPVPPGSVEIAYSNQLMEHLHPDDALEQLRKFSRCSRPGAYIFASRPIACRDHTTYRAILMTRLPASISRNIPPPSCIGCCERSASSERVDT